MKRSQNTCTSASAARTILTVVVAVIAVALSPLSAQQEPKLEASVIHILHVQGRVYMLVGGGSNITVQLGDEAVVLGQFGTAGRMRRHLGFQFLQNLLLQFRFHGV